MKKVIALLLCLLLCLGSISMVSAVNFTDVEAGAYYYEAVYNLGWDEIVGGFPDGTFGPTKPITRAQIAVILVNMLDLDSDTTAPQIFSDVSANYWAYGFISAAAKEGFISGYPDGSFRPEKNVSYDEALTMIVALMGYKLSDLSGTYPTAFTNKAKQLGVMNTCALTGSTAATRANVACFIRDAILVLKENSNYFKYVGPGYTVSLGKDWVYYYTDAPDTNWCHTVLVVENTSSERLFVGLSNFDLYIDDISADFDTSEYFNNSEASYPADELAPGKKMYVDLIYPYKKDSRKTEIMMNFNYSNENEPIITLTRQYL